jgi:enhancer of yellow 2 transcription factor
MVEKDDLGSKELSELQMRASINAKLIETGERDKLRLMLQQKLIECGWKDQVKSIFCQ